jgi:hypothetical protein
MSRRRQELRQVREVAALRAAGRAVTTMLMPAEGASGTAPSAAEATPL